MKLIKDIHTLINVKKSTDNSSLHNREKSEHITYTETELKTNDSRV